MTMKGVTFLLTTPFPRTFQIFLTWVKPRLVRRGLLCEMGWAGLVVKVAQYPVRL